MRIVDDLERHFLLSNIGYPKHVTDKRKVIKVIYINGEKVEVKAISDKGLRGFLTFEGKNYKIYLRLNIKGRRNFIDIPDGTKFRRKTKYGKEY